MNIKNHSLKCNYNFIDVTELSDSNYKKLKKLFVKYKIKSLRNQGELPCGKRVFYNLFDSIVSDTSDSKFDYFIVMQSDNELIGFASFSVLSTGIVDIPYDYGSIKDLCILPEHRRNGFGSILNNHIENIFEHNKVNTVLLSPDPISGIDFWISMGYNDTGIHRGWGRHFVYIKHLKDNENAFQIDNAISNLIEPTDLIGINPYNKAQIKEIYILWKEYCRKNNRKPHKKDVKKMAREARNNKNVSFKALYYNGIIIGFKYKNDFELNYVVYEFEKNVLDGSQQ